MLLTRANVDRIDKAAACEEAASSSYIEGLCTTAAFRVRLNAVKEPMCFSTLLNFTHVIELPMIQRLRLQGPLK